MNPGVDHYLAEGCGRCALGGTPDCKVHKWTNELKQLRVLLLECGLTEEIKWSMPVYTYQKNNIVMLAAFKDFVSISFFKGSLLKDTKGILEKAGENSQIARLIKFTALRDITKLAPIIKTHIYEAIEIEKAGLKVPRKELSEADIPVEFQQKMDAMPALKKAFQALTPGRQRGYLIFFSAPKQNKTREARIEKCLDQILMGKGMQD